MGVYFMEIVVGRDCKTELGELDILSLLWPEKFSVLRVKLRPCCGISIIVRIKGNNDNVQEKRDVVFKNSYCKTWISLKVFGDGIKIAD